MSENIPVEKNLSSNESPASSSVNSQGIPIIPPRPKPKNDLKSTTSSSSSTSTKSSKPEPETGSKEDIDLNEESESDLLDAYGVDSQHQGEKTLESPYEVQGGASNSHNSIDELPQAVSEESASMNHQTDDQDVIDGDKTPGNSNTKASFKENIDETDAADNESSSFNDDMETVLQESHESSDGGSDYSVHLASATQDIPVNGLQESSAEFTKEEEPDNTGGKNDKNEKKQTGNAREEDHTDHKFEAEYASKGDDEENITTGEESLSTKEDPHTQDREEQERSVENPSATASKVPMIPARPARPAGKSKTSNTSLDTDEDTTVEESGKQVSASDEVNQQNIAPNDSPKDSPGISSAEPSDLNKIVSNEPVVGDNTQKAAPEKNPVPKIPVRPTKRPDESKAGPKAPPPKPKKLSSKIEAFQQQLFNSSSNHGKTSNSDTGTTNGGENISNKAPVHRRVFESSGIPLPGMFNPALRPVAVEPKASKEESLKETRTTKRVRGPRGKRLPQAVANASVVSESNRDLEKGSLWAFTFTKASSTETDNTEKVSITNKSPEVVDQPGGESNVGTPANSVEELSESQVTEISSHSEDTKPVSSEGLNLSVEAEMKNSSSDSEAIGET
ncbi:AIM21 [Candida margitis]|uniref:AIM21 n=1 Tax=Candida margitis TaxID=1775924 RepID=UPI0022279CC5|nr:AIM21 [Candida margitis]KAI5969288.1 AIM21 [Candida margitis]